MSATTTSPNSGAKSSECPDFAQIPLEALQALAARFEMGEKRYGRHNWRKGLTDKEYVVGRLNHVIQHAYTLIGKLEGTIPEDGDDDAAAIMWGGTFAVCARKALTITESHTLPPKSK